MSSASAYWLPMLVWVSLAVVFVFAPPSSAGTYSGPIETDHAVDPAISANDSRFIEWASCIDPSRTRFAPDGSSTINQDGGFNSLGELTTAEIAADDSPGYLTVTFPTGISNGDGHDFAVFENGFRHGTNEDGMLGLFAEFAYVDVSTNGSDFARFPAVSQNLAPITGSGAFAGFDVTNVHNLAGKHAAGFGTPFDLSDVLSDPLVGSGQLDLANIQYVRLVDIPGSGDFLDSQGNPIIDSWPTMGSGGFDFRLGKGLGIGVLNVALLPEPSGFGLAAIGLTFLCGHRSRENAGGRHDVNQEGGQIQSEVEIVPSPCIGYCQLTLADCCDGCRRARGEIAEWTQMESAQKRQVAAHSRQRITDAPGLGATFSS